jgi:hypothetical protein
MKRVLPGWSITVSSATSDALTRGTMKALFGKQGGGAITVDREIARFLTEDFELERHGDGEHLLGPRTRDG